MKSKWFFLVFLIFSYSALIVSEFKPSVQAGARQQPPICCNPAEGCTRMANNPNECGQSRAAPAQARRLAEETKFLARTDERDLSGPTSGSSETPLRKGASQGVSWLLLVGGFAVVGRLGLEFLRTFFGSGIRTQKRGVRLVTWGTAVGALMGGAFAAVAWIDFPAHHQAVASSARSNRQSDMDKFTGFLEIGGEAKVQIGGLEVDRLGNVYVTGAFKGSLVFSTTPRTVLESASDYDVFVAKFSPNRTCLWARAANGAAGLTGNFSVNGGLTLAVDSQGNSYVGGGFVSSLTFNRGGSPLVTLTAASGAGLSFEPFVAKFDPDGTLIWAKGGNSGAPKAENPEDSVTAVLGLALDAAGNLLAAGTTTGTNFLGAAVGSAGKGDMVAVRLNPTTGTPVWAAVAGGPNDDGTQSLTVDGTGNLYVIGHCGPGAVFPTEPPTTLTPRTAESAFVAKYDRDGKCVWVREIGSSELVRAMQGSAGENGDLYVSGFFAGDAVFGPNILTSDARIQSGFVAKYNGAGMFQWARDFGKPNYALGNQVKTSPSGGVYVAGVFFGDAVFGGGTASEQTISDSNPNIFLATYNAAGDFQTVKKIDSNKAMSLGFVRFENGIQIITNHVQLALNNTAGLLLVSGDFQDQVIADDFNADADDEDYDDDGDMEDVDDDDDGDDGDGDGDGGDGDDDDGRFVPNQGSPNRSGFVAFQPISRVEVEPPTVALTTPRGGETFKSGETLSITWTSSDKIGVASQEIALSTDGGTTYPVNVAVGLSASIQTFAYRIPASMQTDKGRLRIVVANVAGKSAQDVTPADFKIEKSDTTAPTVSVTAPTAGGTVESVEGARVAVAWTSRDDVGVTSHTVRLTGKRNGTQFTDTVASGLPGTAASFSIAVRRDDAVAEAQVVVEARDAAANRGEGKSGLFTIAAPRADTEKPVVSGVTLSKSSVKRKKDSTVGVAWQSSDNVGVAGHDLSFAADGNTFSTTVASGLSGSVKTFTWTIPASVPKTKTGRVKVVARDAAGNAGEAVSGVLAIK